MKKVLIIVDMQNDFIDGSLGTKEAQDIVNNVVESIKDKKDDYLVLATQDTHFDNYLSTLEGKNLPVMHCIKGTPGWQIQEDIKVLIEDKNIFEKNTFGSEDLINYLKEYQPDEIELLGLCTDICVISNALLLRAAFPNTPISVIEDCCAGVTPEKHQSALNTMESCQIQVI